MDFRFWAVAWVSVVGEKLTRLIEQATQKRYPVLLSVPPVCQDARRYVELNANGKNICRPGTTSLAQLLYIPVLTNPTTGGVTASFAMLGDLILAEPQATIGFAGRRVIEQTLKESSPMNFRRQKTCSKHGFVDANRSSHSAKEKPWHSYSPHQPLTTAPNLVHFEPMTLVRGDVLEAGG
jgi:acetyl-CoA carboxylase carboxyl transferase subunit beta